MVPDVEKKSLSKMVTDRTGKVSGEPPAKCVFPQNFRTRELSEISVFYAKLTTKIKDSKFQNKHQVLKKHDVLQGNF